MHALLRNIRFEYSAVAPSFLSFPMNPSLTVIITVQITIISFHANLLYCCMYADKSYLIDVNPKTLLTPPTRLTACHPLNFIVNSLISNFRATRLPLATQNLLIPKPRELVCLFETLDCITLLDLPAGYVIVNRRFCVFCVCFLLVTFACISLPMFGELNTFKIQNPGKYTATLCGF